jgi:hypothetical protein
MDIKTSNVVVIDGNGKCHQLQGNDLRVACSGIKGQ